MKTKPKHIGNVILAYDRPKDQRGARLFLVKKERRNKKDIRRKRKRVGIGKRVPPGGAYKPSDPSQRHAAQRELWEETGNSWWIPIGSLHKVAELEGYEPRPDSPQSWRRARLKWVVHIYETVIPDHLHGSFRLSKGIVEAGWHPARRLPWREMINGDRFWLPRLVKGQKLRIKVLFDYDFERVVSRLIIRASFR